MHPLLAGLKPPILIAHRGGSKLAPENTLHAYRSAVENQGADMLEIDVHVTKDGEVVAMHDPIVDRCTDGSGPIADMTLAELKRLDAGARFSPDGRSFPFRKAGVTVPTLREVLRALPATRVNVDLKPEDPSWADSLARLLREEGAVNRACVGSKHDAVAERIRHALPEGCHFLPRQALSDFVRAAIRGEDPPDSSCYHVLDLPYELGPMKLANAAVLAAAKWRNLWVNVWTVDDAERMTELLDLGVEGIMSDRPDVLRQVLDARAPAGGAPAPEA